VIARYKKSTPCKAPASTRSFSTLFYFLLYQINPNYSARAHAGVPTFFILYYKFDSSG